MPIEALGEQRDVRVLGDFNNWSWNAAQPMEQQQMDYALTLELPNGNYREYQFRYCIDQQHWLNDPAAERLVDNEFGSQNSLLVVEHPPEETPSPVSAAPDDLKKIEGIGPKIASLLEEHGITSFQALLERSLDELQLILATAGPRYRLHKPDHWQDQARLAATGDWEGLKAYKERLRAAKRKAKQRS